MLPLRISNATRRLAETQNEYTAISIRDSVVNGVEVMSSAWEPTPKEVDLLCEKGGSFCVEYMVLPYRTILALRRRPTDLEKASLLLGASVTLHVPGRVHPPIFIGVDETGSPDLEKALALITVKAPATA